VVAFWPVFNVLAAAMGLYALLQDMPHVVSATALGMAATSAVVIAGLYGVYVFQRPRFSAAVQLVDQTLPNRPISFLSNPSYATSGSSGDTDALWHRHLSSLRYEAESARPARVAIGLAHSDRAGLTLVAVLVAAVGVLFGNFGAPASPSQTAQSQTIAAASWEGWITPPQYSGLPTLYLNELTGLDRIEALQGSVTDIRLYGALTKQNVAQTVSDATPPTEQDDGTDVQFSITQTGSLTIDDTTWAIALRADQQPVISTSGQFQTEFFGETTLDFTAQDDFGVTAATAQLTLDLSRVDRRFGLVADPDFEQVQTFDLPLPFNGQTRDFVLDWVEDHSQSPLAHLPVTLTLSARDQSDQVGQTVISIDALPARKFFDPTAAAVIEQRRDLLWSRDNAKRVARMIRALTYDAQDAFRKESDYLSLRTILRELERAIDTDTLDTARPELAHALWDFAISIEEGDVDDALERMRATQERLSQAMKNGASDTEIERLMQELREANENYLRQLRQQAERDRRDNPDRDFAQGSPEDMMQMDQADLQAMMDRIQELMEQGRMAEAQQALQELQQMMENMQIAEGGQGGEGQGSPMGDLSQTLRDQQQLSDDAFQQLQDQFAPQGNQQGQGQDEGDGQGDGQGDVQGQDPENGQQGGEGSNPSLADRQAQLSDDLARGRSRLPNIANQAGRDGAQALDDAQEAMRRAEQALREGDLDRALDEQADAMETLREGLRSMDRAIAEANPDQQGQGQAANDQGGDQRDPLGRPQGRDGRSGTAQATGPAQDFARQAQELLGEIRKRANDNQRPDVERDYLKRLFDQF
jgi:uncharacterized protein (TIGR02302 family)